jgi:hypothetical protein
MTKRTMLNNSLTLATLLTPVALLLASPAAAAPADMGDPFGPQPAAAASGVGAAMPAPPAANVAPVPARPGSLPLAPGQSPPPTLAARQRQQIFEPEGPSTSWEPLRFAVAAQLHHAWLLDAGAKRVQGGSQVSSQGVSVQGDVLRPTAALALRLDLGWLTTSANSYQVNSSYSYAGDMAERIETNRFTLGAALRFHLLQWLAPYVRLAGGLGRDKVTVSSMSGHQYYGLGSAGAGVFLRSPSIRLWQGAYSPWLGGMATIEGGYTMAAGGDLTLTASPPSSSTEPLPANQVALGHVGRNAPYLRASVGIAF